MDGVALDVEAGEEFPVGVGFVAGLEAGGWAGEWGVGHGDGDDVWADGEGGEVEEVVFF